MTVVWLFTILAYSESALPVPYPIYGCWLIFLLAEILLISLSFVPDISVDDAIGIFSIEIQIIRIFVLITLICLVCASASLTVRRVLLDEETAQPLLHQNRQRFGIMEGTRNYGSCSRDGPLMDDGPYNWRSDAEMLQKRSSVRDWQKILNLIWVRVFLIRFSTFAYSRPAALFFLLALWKAVSKASVSRCCWLLDW